MSITHLCHARYPKPNTWMGLLRNFHASRATDLRDKVYSFLGIAKRYTNGTMPIGYSVEWPEVYTRATKPLIEGEGNLNILATAASGSPALPSWVPKFDGGSPFDINDDNNEMSLNALRVHEQSYCAGGPRLPMMRFWNRGTYLTVHVIFVHNLTCILPH